MMNLIEIVTYAFTFLVGAGIGAAITDMIKEEKNNGSKMDPGRNRDVKERAPDIGDHKEARQD